MYMRTVFTGKKCIPPQKKISTSPPLRAPPTRYSNALSGQLPTQLGALSRLTTNPITVYGNPCLYGTKVDVGGQNYDVSNTAEGSYAVPASCGVAVAMAPIKAAW